MSAESTITPPEVRQQAERQQGFTGYFAERLSNERFAHAVVATRGEIAADYQVYGQAVMQAGQELVGRFGIDPAFFADQAQSEAFLAISESYVALRSRSEDERTGREKKFLEHMLRVLTSDNAQANQYRIGRDPSAHRYIFSPRDLVDREQELARYKELSNPEKSEALKASLLGEGSEILGPERQLLGITPDTEKPFDVLVVDASQEGSLRRNPETGREVRRSEWEELGGKGTKAFTMEMKDRPPTIVLSKDTVEALNSDIPAVREEAAAVIRHEYVHTQRRLRVGHQTLLGGILDEAMASSLSGTTGHGDASALVDLLGMLSADGEKSLTQTLGESIQSDNPAEVYRYISDNFGPRGLLLLLTTLPHAYKGDMGLVPPPEFQLDNLRVGSLFRTLLEERKKIDPDAEGVLERTLVQLKPDEAQDLLLRINAGELKIPGKFKQIPASIVKAYKYR